MALLELPVRSDLKAYSFKIDLDGAIYTLSFRFNQRMQRWFMDIATEDEIELINGIELLTDVILNNQYVVNGAPPGFFICEDTTGESKIAGVDDLGNDVRLLYQEATA